jgi:hypothetical protein
MRIVCATPLIVAMLALLGPGTASFAQSPPPPQPVQHLGPGGPVRASNPSADVKITNRRSVLRVGYVRVLVTPDQWGDLVVRGTLSIEGTDESLRLRKAGRRVRRNGTYPLRLVVPEKALEAAAAAVRRGDRVNVNVSFTVRDPRGRSSVIDRSAALGR